MSVRTTSTTSTKDEPKWQWTAGHMKGKFPCKWLTKRETEHQDGKWLSVLSMTTSIIRAITMSTNIPNTMTKRTPSVTSPMTSVMAQLKFDKNFICNCPCKAGANWVSGKTSENFPPMSRSPLNEGAGHGSGKWIFKYAHWARWHWHW